MSARSPRVMIAKIARVLGDGVVPPLDILEALNDAHQQLNGFYFWPWSIAETNYTFPAPTTGTATSSSQSVTIVTPDPLATDVGPTWRLFLNRRDYQVKSYAGQVVNVESGTGRIEQITTPTAFTLRRCGFLLPTNYQPRTEVLVWDTGRRVPVPHISRLHFERLWMDSATSGPVAAYADAEPYYDDLTRLWYFHLQFVPAPTEGTQVRVVYTKAPAPLTLDADNPPYWPDGFDEAIELIALRRLGETLGFPRAVNAGRRAEGLVASLRRQIADSNLVQAPSYRLGGAAHLSDFPLSGWEFDS